VRPTHCTIPHNTQSRLMSPACGGLIQSLAVLLASWVFIGGAMAQSSQQWPMTDFDKRSIELDEVTSGGPPRDGIPPIDVPKFVDVAAADAWLNDQEPVIALELNGDARAYPLQILMYHEIVNDTVGEMPVSVTFCPLCNASIVFDRRVDDTVLDFGTTGWLRKSDLVMYDRQTESWWQQFVGRGIIGHYTDKELVQLPSVIVSYATFKETYKEGQILSRDTGFQRNYGSNPYAGYDAITSSPFLYRGKLDSRLPPMERILGLPDGDGYQLLPLSALEDRAVVNTRLSDQSMVVFAPGTAKSALDQYEIVQSQRFWLLSMIRNSPLTGRMALLSTPKPVQPGMRLVMRLQAISKVSA